MGFDGIFTIYPNGGSIEIQRPFFLKKNEQEKNIFCFFLIEDAMLDWSAVFLTDVKNIPVELGGVGYATFSIAMTVMRLNSDKIIAKLRPITLVALGGHISACDLLLIVKAASIALILLGFILA